jgi:hypothetical protein
MVKFLSRVKSLLLSGGDDVVSPLYDGISLIGPYAIAVCLTLSIFWGVFLGVKYAKAEDPGEKENLHKVLINFCIGAVTVLILISVVYAIREPLARYIDG